MTYGVCYDCFVLLPFIELLMNYVDSGRRGFHYKFKAYLLVDFVFDVNKAKTITNILSKEITHRTNTNRLVCLKINNV